MDFSSRNPATSNALNLAARNNDVDNVKRLLLKLNPNCVDNRGWTCLHEAAFNNSYESMLLILKNRDCRPLAETHEGHTALYLACKRPCSLDTYRALLDSVDDIANYGSTEGVTPLHVASSLGKIDLIHLLLEYGAMINVQDFDGDTPLHDAVFQAQHEAVLTLLYAGADPGIPNEQGSGYTPFHLACCIGFFPNIESLFPFVDDINLKTESGDSPLSLALRGLNDEIVYFLLKNGADPHMRNSSREMAIDIAVTIDCSTEVFKTLLSVTDRNLLNRNIILKACKPHHFKFEILEILLNSDLDPEFFSVYEPYVIYDRIQHYGDTFHTNAPLNSYLNICGYIYDKSPEKFEEFFYLFLMRGVDVNASNIYECSPLTYAHCTNTSIFREVFAILIEHGCNVDYCSSMENEDKDDGIPEVFRTSLNLYPESAPVMMPYSLYFEPDNFLRYAYERGLLNMIPQYVQKLLLYAVDSAFRCITAESLPYYVPCLKHLSRRKIRSVLRNRKGGVKSTQAFLNIINSLPIPQVIKNYLRYK